MLIIVWPKYHSLKLIWIDFYFVFNMRKLGFACLSHMHTYLYISEHTSYFYMAAMFVFNIILASPSIYMHLQPDGVFND